MEKKVKIIYFSVNDSDAKQLEISWGKFLTLLFATFLALLVLVSATLALFTDFYQNLQIASLKKLNILLQTQMQEMGVKLQQVDAKIKKLEREDDELRLMAELPQLDPDTRDVGVGGFLPVNFTPHGGTDEISEKLLTYQQVLDKIERRYELTKASREEVQRRLKAQAEELRHIPSIRPLLDGRIRDKFGMRLHPILEKVIHHNGVDISAERGTEVFSTAAGRVEMVVTEYKLGRGLGKYVVIDHGYGFKTKYGHLSKVLVRPGQHVSRWDPLGTVGDTGLATGPHLHYEVVLNGKQQDPMKYILN